MYIVHIWSDNIPTFCGPIPIQWASPFKKASKTIISYKFVSISSSPVYSSVEHRAIPTNDGDMICANKFRSISPSVMQSRPTKI